MLDGRVALVTGANHGIGAATAVELSRLGADVVITYLRLAPLGDPSLPAVYDEQRSGDAGDVVAAVEANGRRALAIEVDLRDPAAPARLFDAAEQAFGRRIEILVNNASGWRADTFAPDADQRFGRRTSMVSAETFDDVLSVDAKAAALLIAELARRCDPDPDPDRGWGRIVGLTSGGPEGFPHEASYGAAKSALESYTKTAALELRARGITANVVHPPVTDTGWVTDEVRAEAERLHMRVADPADVAKVIGWLCTDDAALVTGNVIRLR